MLADIPTKLLDTGEIFDIKPNHCMPYHDAGTTSRLFQYSGDFLIQTELDSAKLFICRAQIIVCAN